MLRVTVLFAFILAFASACGGGRSGGRRDAGGLDGDGATVSPDGAVSRGGAAEDEAGPGACRATAECDDGIACTEDTCRFPSRCAEGEDCIGYCVHVPVPARCSAGETCDVRHGCLPGRACSSDDMCESTNACMVVEGCDPAARVCVIVPLDGDGDGNRPRVCGGTDCDDSRDDVFRGAAEACNGIDDDCDGTVDEKPEADDACGPGASCVEGGCQCDDAGLELCADALCVDLQNDPGHCGSCWYPCHSDELCVEGTCRECGGRGQACCTDSTCFGLNECISGTCRALACTEPLEYLPERLLPRCSAATLDCYLAGGTDCKAADTTPPEEGVDCSGCIAHQISACGASYCQYSWERFVCCEAARCASERTLDCVTRECGPERDEYLSCLRANGCHYVDGTKAVTRCFPR